MPDSVGTMALKLSVDAQGWSTGLRSASDEQTKFVDRTKAANDGIAKTSADSAGKVTGFFDKIKTGGSGAVFSEVKSGLGEVVSGLGGGAAAAASFGGALAAGLTLITEKAREASKEVNNVAKFAERIGSSVHDAEVLKKAFELGGIEDAEHALNRIFQKIGEIRTDPTGGTAQALERLNLDPQRISGLPSRQAIQEIVEALGHVPNVYDRIHLSQQISGKGFQELQELIRRGASGFELAERQVHAFGVDPQVVQMARDAEREWRVFGETTGAIGGKIKRGFTDVGVAISLQLAQAANAASRFFGLVDEAARRPVTDATATGVGGMWGEEVERARTAQEEIARIVVAGPRIRPVADIGVQIGRETEAMQDRIRLDETARSSAERLGLVRVNATNQEVAAVRDLVAARDALVKKGGTSEQLSGFDATIRAAAESRRSRAAEDQVRALEQEVRLAGLTPGLVQARLAAEQQVNERLTFRLDFLARERDLMNSLVQASRSIVESTFSPVDRLGRVLGQIDQMRTRLGPNGLPILNEVQAQRALGAAFRGLEQHLGGPSSFVVNAPSAGSVELANIIADLEIRQRHGVDDPAQRVPQLLQVLIEGQAEGNRVNERVGEAVQRVLQQLPQVPAGI